MSKTLVRVVLRNRGCTIRRIGANWYATESGIHSSGGDGANQDHKSENLVKEDVQQYDIAIVGGGLVGMALACALASSPLTRKLSVAIIDSNPALRSGVQIRKDEPPDPRVSTITPASIHFLRDIGAWNYVEQHRHAYFKKMQVWDYTGLGYTRYNAKDVDKEVLG